MGKHRDWSVIEKDYRENGLNYVQLAEKYGVSISSLSKAAARQGWRQGAKKARAVKAGKAARILDKMEISDSETESEIPFGMESAKHSISAESDKDRMSRLIGGMADRIEKAIFRVAADDKADLNAIKTLVSALKDLRDLQFLNKSEQDLEEQRARIEKLKAETAALKRQADKEQAMNEAITVEFVDLEGAEL